MKLIVGLGNPEPKYDNTRHNIGFMVLNDYANRCGLSFKKKFNGYSCDFTINGEKAILLKPDTYMNNSGEAVRKYMDFYNIDYKDIIIIHDDIDLMYGKNRLKTNSSSGGQNGIKSIINHLGTKDFLRLKIGVNSEYKKDAASFVLSGFSKIEKQSLNEIYDHGFNVIEDITRGVDTNTLMNKYN